MVHSSRPRRHFIKRKRGDALLEERDPSLINLPFPVPSIPIISNLLDPLISGEKPHSSSSAQASEPTATSVPSSPDNSGDNGASSSDSGDNSSSASDNDTGSESGSSSSSESGSGSNGSSPTVSTSASTPTAATGKGSSSVDTSDAKPTSSQGEVASPSVASTSVAAAATTSVSEATDVNTESAGSATSTASNAPSSPIANVAVAVNDHDSSSTAQAAGISSSHSAQPTAIGSLGAGIGSSSGSDTNSGTDNNNSSSAIAANHSSLSGGAIAGIIIAALIAGGLLIVFVMRRRAMNKRKARQTAWFFGRNAGNANADPAARISTRSSWGTPFDGRALYTDAMSPTPDSAPNTMAQLNSAPLTAPPVVVTQKQNTRASMYSIGSASSEGSGEGLPLPAPVYGEEMPSTPMSARAFSPMDGHAFPKPPSTTSSHSKEEKRKSVDELIDLNNPFADRLPPGASPFADPVVPVTPGARASVGSSVGSAGSVIGIGTRVTIARPFTPSLHDEIGVIPGDEVIVLQAFDDGWVQIRNANKDVGLVPLDCLRPEGQDTAEFLASKRVSSFFQAGFLQ